MQCKKTIIYCTAINLDANIAQTATVRSFQTKNIFIISTDYFLWTIILDLKTFKEMCVVSAKVVQLMVYAFVEIIFQLTCIFLRIVFNYCFCVEKLHYPGCSEVNSINQSQGEQMPTLMHHKLCKSIWPWYAFKITKRLCIDAPNLNYSFYIYTQQTSMNN